MKIQTFIEKIKNMDVYQLRQYFDKDYGESCPCFSGIKTINKKTLIVWARCWRVSENLQDLRIGGTLDKKDKQAIAKIIKKALDKEKWYNPYTIIYS